jgi:hypothetical protein
MIAQSKTAGRNGRRQLRPMRYPYRSTQVTHSESFIRRSELSEESSAYTATEEKSAYAGIDACEWLPFVRNQLDAIESLPDGWDSNGASSPIQSWVASARSFIDNLSQEENLPQPYVNPSRGGGIQFEWELGPRYFEVEIVGERAAAYFYCDTEKREEEEGKLLVGDSLQKILQYIYRIFGN